MHTQVVLLTVILNKVIETDPKKFREQAFDTVRYIEERFPDLCRRIEDTGVMTEEDGQFILSEAKQYVERVYGE